MQSSAVKNLKCVKLLQGVGSFTKIFYIRAVLYECITGVVHTIWPNICGYFGVPFEKSCIPYIEKNCKLTFNVMRLVCKYYNHFYKVRSTPDTCWLNTVNLVTRSKSNFQMLHFHWLRLVNILILSKLSKLKLQ